MTDWHMEIVNSAAYLDNASTTRILPAVSIAMEPFLDQLYGNASSHHNLGRKSRAAIEESREIIASIIKCNPNEIYFTSGGSEANTWAIRGLKKIYRFNPMHVIASSQEHHSVLNALKARWNENEDIEYSLVNPEANGKVDPAAVSELFKLNTRLVSIMAVNNETGVIQPIQDIAYKCKNNGIIFHCDCVQAFGYLQLYVKDLGIDMMSISSHKIQGPKGVGALYISEGIRNQMVPWISGGQQERGMRGSTENVASIVGFAKAAEIAYQTIEENNEYIKGLCEKLIEMLSEIPGVHTNVNIRDTDYRHISIRVDGVRAEELMTLLDNVDICVSSGSACNSNSNEPSHVLKAIGLTDEEANSTIRVSINERNTVSELQLFTIYLKEFITILRRR